MNKTFRQIFKEEDHLAHNVANRWGYQIKHISLSEKKQLRNVAPIIANMNTLKQTKDIQKTERIQQIQQQIQELKNERKLNQLKDLARGYNQSQLMGKQETSQIIKLMEDKIREYNYIVNHKHLAERSSDEARKVLKMGQKASTQNILEKIKQQNSLFKSENLTSQIEHNKQMTTLYKEYHEKLAIKIRNNKKAILFNTISSEPPNSNKVLGKNKAAHIETIEFAQNYKYNTKNEINTRSDKLFNINISSQQHLSIKKQLYNQLSSKHQSLKKGFKKQLTEPQKLTPISYHIKTEKNLSHYKEISQMNKKEQKQILQPFIDKEQFQLYSNIEKKNLNNKQILQLYRFRIKEYQDKYQDFYAKNHRKSHKKDKSLAEEANFLISRQLHQQQKNQHKRRSKSSLVQMYQTTQNESDKRQNKQFSSSIDHQHSIRPQDQQQKMLGQFLRKKLNTLNKVGLKQQIIKQDEISQVKSILKREPVKVHINSQLFRSRQNQNNNKKNLSKSNISAEYAEIKKQLDDKFYETLYKNEKFNLLSKKR